MRRYIDLSGPLENGMWGYYELPGLENIIPRVEISTVAKVAKEGFFSSRLVFSTISGTYLEAGSHMLENGKNIDDYSINDFIKPVNLVRIPKQKTKALIDAELLERYSPSIRAGGALIIDTGWGKMWNKPGYVLQCPNYSRNALEWVLNKDISIFGVDVPCIETSWSEDNEKQKGSLLKELFASGVLLLAPLVNLERIEGNSGTLYCFPLKVKGVSGAPARVIWEQEI